MSAETETETETLSTSTIVPTLSFKYTVVVLMQDKQKNKSATKAVNVCTRWVSKTKTTFFCPLPECVLWNFIKLTRPKARQRPTKHAPSEENATSVNVTTIDELVLYSHDNSSFNMPISGVCIPSHRSFFCRSLGLKYLKRRPLKNWLKQAEL